MKVIDIKIRCIEDLPPFIKDKEYLTDNRVFSNREDGNDKQVIIVESETDDGLLNCYLVPLDKFFLNFEEISCISQ